MNLFALTSVPGQRIIRFPLTQELQAEVQDVFSGQLNAFLSGVQEEIAFDGRYVPENDQLLVINEFVDVDGMHEAVANPLSIEQYDPNMHSLEQVKAIFTGVLDNGRSRVLIQQFESRRLIATNGLAIFFSGNTFQRMNDAGLTLDSKLLAVLEGATIKFQSFHYLRRIFDMSDYFNEATNEEVTTFAAHEKLFVNDVNEFLANASPLVRKKIALIKQSGVLDKFTTEQIIATAQTFNLNFEATDDGRIVLPQNKTELRRLLRFLDEDYYESPLSQTLFVTNSKRVAG